MAAQAVDFKISGHVNRALFVVDKNLADEAMNGTKARVQDNGGSSTRVRVTGSTELEGGNKVGIQWEYQQGSVRNSADDGSATSLTLRHANVQYSGGFGKITIGQGSEAGDGSAYSDTTGVFGIGHGAGTSSDFSLGDYFGSLDAGGRVEMVRYDTPALGPVSAAVSVANGDRVSGLLQLSSEFGGTTFGAKLATLQKPGDTSTLGASFGATMASGLTLSGAWAKGKDQGAKPSSVEIEAVEECPEASELKPTEACLPITSGAVTGGVKYSLSAARAATDPSYLQAEVGYKFGNSGVALSWYKSDDFVAKGSEGTAIGIGARHTLPKVNAELYTAVQNYSVKKMEGAESEKETVFVVGTRVKF